MIWVLKGGYYHCSNCNGRVTQAAGFKYCPFCGDPKDGFKPLPIPSEEMIYPLSDKIFEKIAYEQYQPGEVIHDHMIF